MAKIVKLSEKDREKSEKINEALREVQKVIVGQEPMIKALLTGLLARGHILLEGVPGLAKTLSVKTLASTIQAKFSRIQFTPDLLPADLVEPGCITRAQAVSQFPWGPYSRTSCWLTR